MKSSLERRPSTENQTATPTLQDQSAVAQNRLKRRRWQGSSNTLPSLGWSKNRSSNPTDALKSNGTVDCKHSVSTHVHDALSGLHEDDSALVTEVLSTSCNLSKVLQEHHNVNNIVGIVQEGTPAWTDRQPVAQAKRTQTNLANLCFLHFSASNYLRTSGVTCIQDAQSCYVT
eukprot:3157216-Amphidinium_carterae.1